MIMITDSFIQIQKWAFQMPRNHLTIPTVLFIWIRSALNTRKSKYTDLLKPVELGNKMKKTTEPRNAHTYLIFENNNNHNHS